MSLAVDQVRLAAELIALGEISEHPSPVVTRVVFTEADLRGREYVNGLCREAGLEIRQDAVGNTFATWAGSDRTLAPVGTGSHIDAIPNAGKYDGTAGVLGGLEAIRTLQRAGIRPRRSIELVTFTSEEPTRFGIGCLGSRMLGGFLGAEVGQRLRDRDGVTLDDARTNAGFHGDLASVALPTGYFHAFAELHIEQGPILEAENLPIGIVEAIAAPAGLKMQIEGVGGHAGAVLMPERHDAFLAAAEIALALEASARSSGAVDTVATVGVCNVFPGAVNSIPSRVGIEVDIRDIDLARRDRVLADLKLAADQVVSRRGVKITTELVNADPPAICAPLVLDALTRSCAEAGLAHKRMISRAYHDSLFIARIVPTAMVFIPCRGGVSHRPDEYSSPEAIAAGTRVLAGALAELAA